MSIPSEQLANAYAFAKTTGSELSFEEFEKMYTKYYEEAIQTTTSRPVEPAKANVTSIPW